MVKFKLFVHAQTCTLSGLSWQALMLFNVMNGQSFCQVNLCRKLITYVAPVFCGALLEAITLNVLRQDNDW